MPLTAVLMGDPFPGRRELVAQHKPERAQAFDPSECLPRLGERREARQFFGVGANYQLSRRGLAG
jgi:hypothetical protein